MIASGEGSSITIFGRDVDNLFLTGRAIIPQSQYLLAYATDKARVELDLTGYFLHALGDMVVNKGATLEFSTTSGLGDLRIMTAWTHAGGINEAPTENDNSRIIVNLVDPDPSTVAPEDLAPATGRVVNPIEAKTSHSTITVNAQGKNSFTGGARSVGAFVDGVRYGGNTITLNYSGENAGADMATFEALADNRLEANFGNSTYFNGVVHNRGQMKLHFSSGSAWGGASSHMENFRDETGKLWTSHLSVTMDPNTAWYEDFFQNSGISDIRLNQARREGHMYVQGPFASTESSQLTLNASNRTEWLGDLLLDGGSTEANFVASQWRGNAFLRAAGLDLNVTDKSIWHGDLTLNEGEAKVTVADANWKGDAILDNLANGGTLELNVEKDTTWDGALNIAEGKATVSVKGAEWKQGVTMANSRFNSLTESEITSLNSSSDTPVDTNVSAPLKAGDLTLYVGDNTHWTGDVNITNGTAKIDTDHIRWEGNVTLASDLFKATSAEKILDTVSLTTATAHGTGSEFSVYRPYYLEDLAGMLPAVLEKFAQSNKALQKISEDGKLALSLTNTEWKGDLSISRGTATVELTDSK